MSRFVNEYDMSGEYGKCFIKGGFFIFDKEDYDKIKNYKWFLSQGYPTTHEKKTYKMIRYHRFIMDCPLNKVVDHINHNTLDNRKSNLRICEKAENNRNVKETSQNSSGVRGVSLNTQRNRWNARIIYNGKEYFLGAFKDKGEAIKARKEAEKRYYGEFAYKEV